MTITSTEPTEAVKRLSEAHRVLLTCHLNPDGDSLGSELALVELAGELVRLSSINSQAARKKLMAVGERTSLADANT